MTEDNFSEPKPSTLISHPTRHVYNRGGGYMSSYCGACGADEYPEHNEAVPTEYCEDFEWAKKEWKAIREHRHAATEEAIRVARSALTAEQWTLLGLNKLRPYRDKDYIKV